MKIKSLIYTSLAAALLFTSCEDLNKEPVFNDDTQAFVAFEKTTGTVIESNDGVPAVLEAPLYCGSVRGLEATVKFAFDNSKYGNVNAAVQGRDYEPLYVVRYSIDYNNQSATFMQRINVDTLHLTPAEEYSFKFDKEHPFAAIAVRTIDNDAQESNKKFDIVLKEADVCNLGANKVFAVTINDDENPMTKLLGSYAATAASMFQGYPDEEWDVEISADDEDPTKIWIQPICIFGGLGASDINPVYAVVDVVQGSIQVPYGQLLFGGEGQTYYMIIAGLTNSGEPVKSGNALAFFTIDSEGVMIEFEAGYGVGNDAANEYWYQAIDAPVFIKK